jgi:Arc/MetJ family transcription regulator
MTTYRENCIFEPLHVTRTISHGKSAEFPALGKMTARYHTPGTPILGSNNPQIGRTIINIDDLLIADVTIYDLEDMKNHFDVRTEYSAQLGMALANRKDRTLAKLGYLAARSAGLTADYQGGSVITVANAHTDATVLATAIRKAAQVFDEKDVPKSDRHVILAPAQYWLLVGNKELLNRDWGGAGSLASGTLPETAGIQIHQSNHLPNGSNVTAAEAGERNAYTGNFTNSVALVMNRAALGTVKLMDLTMQIADSDFRVMYQSTLIVAKYAMGHGILRPDCAVEIAKPAA